MNLKVIIVDCNQQRNAVLSANILISKLANSAVSFSCSQQALAHISKNIKPGDYYLIFLNLESGTQASLDFLRALKQAAFHTKVLVLILSPNPAPLAQKFSAERQVLSVIKSPVSVEEINLCGIKALKRIISAEGFFYHRMYV